MARDALSRQLQTILIRRTGDTLLRELLPRRREYIVAVSMQGSQKEQYLKVAHSLLKEGAISTGRDCYDNLRDLSHKNGTTIIIALPRLATVLMVLFSFWHVLFLLYYVSGTQKNRKNGSAPVIEEEAEEEEEEEEESASRGSAPLRRPPTPAVVLPGLQQLRVLCSSGDPGRVVTSSEGSSEGSRAHSGASKRSRTEDDRPHPVRASSSSGTIADTMSNSSKLHVRQCPYYDHIYSPIKCI